VKRFAFLALCLIATACRRDGEGDGTPSFPDPSGYPPGWIEPTAPDNPDEGNDPWTTSECVPNPPPEVLPTPVDDDGGADVGDPGFTITITPDSFNILPGESIDLAVTVTRAADFAEAIDVTVDGLPAGVTASSLFLTADECECAHTITLVSDPGLSTPHANAARVRGNAASGTRGALIDLSVRDLTAKVDQSFGVNGKVGAMHIITDLAEQPDGKLVFTGAANYVQTVCRVDSNGALDASFGVDGCAFAEMGSEASRVHIQPDGMILVATRYTDDATLARFTADGVLDTSFGTAGVATIAGMPGEDTHLLTVGGRIVVGRGAFVARLESNGAIDESFGTYGRIHLAASQGLVASGECGFVGASTGGLTKIDWNGDKDFEFGLSGSAPVPFGVRATVATLDGKLYAAGYGAQVARYTAGGALAGQDPGFGALYAAGLDVASDGRVLLAGDHHVDEKPCLALQRRNADGTPDAAFNTSGMGGTIYQVEAYARGVKVLRDGRYVVFGSNRSMGEGAIYRVWD